MVHGVPETDWLSRVVIVLVRPKYPQNIGATARAMATMGLTRLRVVGGPPFRENDEALRLARHAAKLLHKADHCGDLSEALEDCDWVVGTSHRSKLTDHLEIVDLEEGASRWRREFADEQTLAILFGREDRGLNAEELSVCNELMTISTAASEQSLNLSQAVMIVCNRLYQLACSDAVMEPHTKSDECDEFDESQICAESAESDDSSCSGLWKRRQALATTVLEQLTQQQVTLRDDGEKLRNSLFQAFSQLDERGLGTLQFVFRKLARGAQAEAD